MSRKHVAFLLIVSLFLIAAMVSCGSPAQTPPETAPLLPKEEPAAGTQNASDPRFVTPPAAPAIDIPKIDFPTIPAGNITASRDLKGTWRGTGISYLIDQGNLQRVARRTWDVTLVITQQQDNTVGGTLTMTEIKQDPQIFPPVGTWGPDAISNGRVTGAALSFDIDDWHWGFSFTSDLMSGHFVVNEPGSPCDPKSFNLTRQN